MAKKLTALIWVEDLLPEGILRKPMFGGFAYYLEDRLVLVLFENLNDRAHQGKLYEFEIWFGCLFPAERKDHAELLRRYPFLRPHPVLGKWLYLPSETEDFETHVEQILAQIRARSPLFGVVPPTKKKRTEGLKKEIKVTADRQKSILRENIDTKVPRMFSDQPIRKIKASARRVSDLKNLGPKSEKEFERAGIKSVADLFQLGWKKAMQKLVQANPKNRQSVFAYALIGALTNQVWHRISDKQKEEARRFVKSLKVSPP